MGFTELAGLRTCFAGTGNRTELGKLDGTRRRLRLETSRLGPNLLRFLCLNLSLINTHLQLFLWSLTKGLLSRGSSMPSVSLRMHVIYNASQERTSEPSFDKLRFKDAGDPILD